eukprot:jgi/Antlo1/1909/2392
MKRIRDYKKPQCTEYIDIKRPVKKDLVKIKLPYDLTTLLIKYNTKFLSIRNYKNEEFCAFKKNIKNVDKKSCERNLYTNDRNPFVTPIVNFNSLESLELNSHDKIDVNVLNSSTLKELSMHGIGRIEKKGRMKLKALKKLVISNSIISFKAFKSFLVQKTLVDLEVTQIRFRKKVRNEKILRIFKRTQGLRRLVIDNCNISDAIYYPIATSLNLNNFSFTTSEGKVSFNISIASSLEIVLSNFDRRFYGYNCAYIQSVVCLDKFLDPDNLCRLQIVNLKEFHTCNTRVEKIFVENFLFRFDSLKKLSFTRCHIDSVLLYSMIRKYSKTLRHLDVSHVVVPFDFLNTCRCFLQKCLVIYGGVPSTIYINQNGLF